MVNYFLCNDPAKWHTNIVISAGVTYSQVYPGIDLAWHGAGSGKDLEYDFIVAPGADPSRIALDFEGARALRIDTNGDLLIDMGDGNLACYRAPVRYQEGNGARSTVSGAYVVSASPTSRRRLPAVDRQAVLPDSHVEAAVADLVRRNLVREDNSCVRMHRKDQPVEPVEQGAVLGRDGVDVALHCFVHPGHRHRPPVSTVSSNPER